MKLTTNDVSSSWEHSLPMRWNFGMCSSVNEYFKNTKYIERCCVPPGENTLTCYNDPNWIDIIRGWKYAQLEIERQGYCDDFITQKAMRKVMISGR